MTAVAENCTALETAVRSRSPIPADCAQRLQAATEQAITDLRQVL